jgi:membrane-associated protease RseP (regulator of RpoE activity)
MRDLIPLAVRWRAYRHMPRESVIRRRPWIINLALFLTTVVTTTFIGALYVNHKTDSWILFFLSGWVFSVPLMGVLLVHEMGHYIMGRIRYLDVTPPYFIPAPPPFFLGTFGAFIKIRSPITDKNVLMEVGSGGPIAGAVVGIPLLLLGLYLSDVQPGVSAEKGISFGSSIVLELLCLVRFGDFSTNTTILLHPTAMAAWFGLFVTAMNLLPIGQLDGGHVVYALFGPRVAQVVSVVVLLTLIPLGYFLWPGWFVFGLLAAFLGMRHPPPIDTYSPLNKTSRLMGWASIVLFVLTFIPIPISFIE